MLPGFILFVSLSITLANYSVRARINGLHPLPPNRSRTPDIPSTQTTVSAQSPVLWALYCWDSSRRFFVWSRRFSMLNFRFVTGGWRSGLRNLSNSLLGRRIVGREVSMRECKHISKYRKSLYEGSGSLSSGSLPLLNHSPRHWL